MRSALLRLSSSLSLMVGVSASAVPMDWTPIGNPGNACDPQSQGCFGAIGYSYSIGTYVTRPGHETTPSPPSPPVVGSISTIARHGSRSGALKRGCEDGRIGLRTPACFNIAGLLAIGGWR